jgi:hypothetical protein
LYSLSACHGRGVSISYNRPNFIFFLRPGMRRREARPERSRRVVTAVLRIAGMIVVGREYFDVCGTLRTLIQLTVFNLEVFILKMICLSSKTIGMRRRY